VTAVFRPSWHGSGTLLVVSSATAYGLCVVRRRQLRPVTLGDGRRCGLRHKHKTWMDEDQIADMLKSERLGHEEPGMPGCTGMSARQCGTS